MTLTDVLKEMDRTSPPFQPCINAEAKLYQQRLLSWNPTCIKKDALFYQFITDSNGVCAVDLIPDACMNILFCCDQDRPSATMSGIYLGPTTVQLEPDTTYFGFKPYSCLGTRRNQSSCGALTDQQAELGTILPEADALLERIAGARSFEQRIGMFMNYAQEHIIDPDYSPNFIDYFVVMICASRGNITFNNLEQVTGYSERYCREKFKNTYGISPKRYSGMMRFQNVLKALLIHDCSDLSALAFDNGYFDQAHFIHDFKKFTGTSPYKFKQSYLKRQSSKVSYLEAI